MDGTDRTAIREQLGARFERVVVEDAPPQVIESIVAGFRARTRSSAAPGLAGRVAARVRAALAFDDLTAGPALALRGVAAPPAGPRHLVYSVDAPGGPAEVAVSLYPSTGDRVTIVGQLLSDEEVSHLVEVMVGDDVVAAAVCSDHGEFTLDAPAGWQAIVLVGADTEIVVTLEREGTGDA